MLMLLVFPILYVDVQSPNLHPETKLVVKHKSNELTPLTSLSVTNTPSIITKTPAALLLIQGGRRGEEPPTPPHQHTQTQGPQNIPSLTIATQEQHTLSWRSGDPGIRGGLGRAGPSPYSSYSVSEHLNVTPRQGHQSYPTRPTL